MLLTVGVEVELEPIFTGYAMSHVEVVVDLDLQTHNARVNLMTFSCMYTLIPALTLLIPALTLLIPTINVSRSASIAPIALSKIADNCRPAKMSRMI